MSSIWFYEPFYDFERFFDDHLAPHWGGGHPQRHPTEESAVTLRNLKPRMNLHEDAEKNMVTASFELPGLKKDQVNINVHNGRLTISGETKESEEHDKGGYAIRERRCGNFSRTLQLPAGVKDDQIKAIMEDGILVVTFPKSSPEAAAKKITVS
ncbi:HSP20-like chaperone [Pluteus cervinus]|uniref:HSP20-like chaperone n=1 Tax=Pluteus cervinus TaxID=181527 RepID=A0ACD3BDQ4_9AGAR|nr:HSP20-like chaperone [Pluteus cervinus]